MLQQDKILRNQTIALSVLVSLLITVGFAFHEYSNLKNRINTDILPSIVAEFNSVTSYTQNQFQFLQFTALQHNGMTVDSRPILSEKQPRLIEKCRSLIETDPITLQFSNRTAQNASGIDVRNGVLLGVGDINQYSTESLNMLCTAVTTSSANSEVIRLAKAQPIISSQYYFVSRNTDFMFLFDRAFSEGSLVKYFTPELKKQYEANPSRYGNLWVTKPYLDNETKKQTITLVENVKDYRNQVIGFLARDVYLDDLITMFDKTLEQRDSHIHLMNYGLLEFLNNNSVILKHLAKDINLDGRKILRFESTPSAKSKTQFGEMKARLSVPLTAMISLIFDEQPYLFFMPLFVLLFSYTILQQMLRGIRESDKQFFDSLTQVYNRHGLYQKVYKKIDKALNNNKDAHIFSIDANKFKQINDKYGHDTGDKAIVLIAKAAKHICQPHDDIVRLGGDEFLIVLYIDTKNEFDPEQFMIRLNQKLAYDCKVNSIPVFSVSGGYVLFGENSHETLSQSIKEADSILMNKKSIDKIDTICYEFDSFNINLSSAEQDIKLDMVDKLDFIQAEHLLQSELNEAVLSAYHGKLNYLISNYLKMIYSCTRENDNLHHYRMKIVESHYEAGIPMSVFYFLFVKYSNFLFRDVEINHDEFVINNRLLSYELHFMSSLKA